MVVVVVMGSADLQFLKIVSKHDLHAAAAALFLKQKRGKEVWLGERKEEG